MDELLNGAFDLLAVFLACSIPLCVAGIACKVWMNRTEKRMKRAVSRQLARSMDWLNQFEHRQ